ncbi:hypothetical protein BOX15_Mlig019308g6, partial [Macrostomum lignano]
TSGLASTSPPGRLKPFIIVTTLLLLLAGCGCFCCYWLDLLDGGEEAYGIGHKRPFGTSRHPQLPVPELADGFPPPGRFYQEQVRQLRPLLMRGAARQTRAFRMWDDDYFLQLPLDPNSSQVHVETTKKESRQQRTYDTPFHQFVRSYNTSGHYMVASMPRFLAPDFPLPWSLQCPDVAGALVEAIVWFSSGGTSSVVHTDAVDNLNCVLRGNKTFVMVDPAVHGHRVPIDRPEGSYSSMDVDSVDFRAYPGMADVQFYIAHLFPGDCLYIPFKWIHQVRSYGRNIAVNLWFDTALVRATDNCNEERPDPAWLIDTASFKGFGYRPPTDLFAETLRQAAGPLDFAALLDRIVPEHGELKTRFGDRFVDELSIVFKAFDTNGDSLVDLAEVEGQPVERLRDIDRHFLQFDRTVREMMEILARERDEL